MSSSTIPGLVSGYIGLVALVLPVVPQIYKNHKSKNTHGLSPILFIASGLSAMSFGAYAIADGIALPLLLQPQFYALSCCIALAQLARFTWGYSVVRAVGVGIGFFIGFFGLQGVLIGIIIVLMRGHQTTWLNLVLNIICAALTLVQFVAQFIKIAKTRDTKSLSPVFLILNLVGAVAYISSLTLDAVLIPTAYNLLATPNYVVVGVCSIGLLLCKARFDRRLRTDDVEDKVGLELVEEMTWVEPSLMAIAKTKN